MMWLEVASARGNDHPTVIAEIIHLDEDVADGIFQMTGLTAFVAVQGKAGVLAAVHQTAYYRPLAQRRCHIDHDRQPRIAVIGLKANPE